MKSLAETIETIENRKNEYINNYVMALKRNEELVEKGWTLSRSKIELSYDNSSFKYVSPTQMQNADAN